MRKVKYMLKRECKGFPAGTFGEYVEEHDAFIFKHCGKNVIISSHGFGDMSALNLSRFSGFIVSEVIEDEDEVNL